MSRKILGIFLLSLAVQLGTLPLTAYYFNYVSVIAILANLVVVPAVGVILALGFTSTILSILWGPLAELYAQTNWLIIHLLIKFVKWAASLPFACWDCPRPTVDFIIGYYVVLGFLSYSNKKAVRKAFFIFLLLALNLAVWRICFRDNHWLTMVFFDVGQGDAALIRFPEGKNMLIDGGERKYNFDTGANIIGPYLRREGIKKLDAMVLTHPHNDHIGGLPYILRHFQVGQVIDTGCELESKAFQEYQFLIDSLKILHRIVRSGDRIGGFGQAEIWILHPTADFVEGNFGGRARLNNSSVVMKIIWGEKSFLLAGDAESEAEQVMLRYQQLLQSDVLKVAHHGGVTSSSLEFLRQVNPRYAVISVGEFNAFNQPSDIILRRLKILGIETIRTDQNGACIFKTDGKKLIRVR